ncbi:Signal recognition particle receptor FtsY [Halomonadaceae bacterium LMG 33818]|uniref:signal recognition particle-docking protein FtsY n=1 Tax=Cernens ardua TaxID=3402176 RepID=UPI003EDBCE21
MFGFFKRKKNHDKSVEEKDKSVHQEEQGEQQASTDAASTIEEKPDSSAASSEEQPPRVALDTDETAADEEAPAYVPSLNTTDPHGDSSAESTHPTHVPQLKSESSEVPETPAPAKTSSDTPHNAHAVEQAPSITAADETAAADEMPSEKDNAAETGTSARHSHTDTADTLSTDQSSVDAAPMDEAPIQPVASGADADSAPEKETKAARGGWFSRMRSGLSKTRNNFTGGLATLFLGKKEIDDELIEDLETQLLVADVGVEATTQIIDTLSERVSRKELSSADALYKALQQELGNMLAPVEKPLVLPPKGQGPFVILVIGVNGVGKTTTIGKLARRYKSEGRSVMLAAGDTFRAAAVEQLKVWGDRNDVPVVAQHTGADSASVIYDALSSARSRNVDVLIADTAGRLHNKSHLMEELKKVQRVMAKLDPDAPHEVMLVLDAGTGQNAISQAETFGDAIPITGIALTKLDGTAKGGVIFALAKQLGIPIRYIGVGESLEDLRPFEAAPFTEALFDQRSN